MADLGPGSGVVAVAAGRQHSLTLRSDGAVLAWGSDGDGQLGVAGPEDRQMSPAVVTGLGPGGGVVGIAAGAYHSLALRSDGTVLAWGHGALGQLGEGRPWIRRCPPR